MLRLNRNLATCDAGELVAFSVNNGPECYRKVAMTVTVPQGRIVLFASDGPWPVFAIPYFRQGEAVRAFVEQHRGF